jgi:hypothetical protein
MKRASTEPTALGLWAIAPAPMTSKQLADLVARARGGTTVASMTAAVGSRARWDRMQAQECARDTAPPAPLSSKPRRGRSGKPSTLSPRAQAILKRTKTARADDRIPFWLLPTKAP